MVDPLMPSGRVEAAGVFSLGGSGLRSVDPRILLGSHALSSPTLNPALQTIGINCQIGVNLMAELFDFWSGLVSCVVIALAPLSLTSTGYFPELNRSALSEIF